MGSMFGNVFRAVTRNPLVKIGASFVPGLSTALTVANVAATGYGIMGGVGGAGGFGGAMPALPGGTAGNAMPMNGPGGGFAGVSPYAGQRTIFGNDPNVNAQLKGQVISKGNLRQYYRAPKGYVVMKDEKGDPMGVPRAVAKQYGWKPAKKPLLSIRDTNAIRHAGAVINKLKKFNKTVEKIANFHSTRRRPGLRTIITEAPGKLQIGRKAAA